MVLQPHPSGAMIRTMSGSSTAHLRADELDVEFDHLYLRHYRDVFRYSLVLLRDASDAEDVTGEVFERGLRSWRAGRRPTGEPLSWLLLVARRIVIDRGRRRRLVRWLPFTGTGSTGHARAAVDIERMEFWVWFHQLATALTSRQREVLLLRYQYDLADEEIGRIMGLSEPGVRSLASRALAALRNHPELTR
jgi:RNA polymerase sigma factor (sigma-70 family)